MCHALTNCEIVNGIKSRECFGTFKAVRTLALFYENLHLVAATTVVVVVRQNGDLCRTLQAIVANIAITFA